LYQIWEKLSHFCINLGKVGKVGKSVKKWEKELGKVGNEAWAKAKSETKSKQKPSQFLPAFFTASGCMYVSGVHQQLSSLSPTPA
jgi:hypothetical protein